MTKMTEIMNDLSRHYRERVGDLTDDALDTMEIAEIPKRERIVIVMRNLLLHAACLGMAYKMSKPAFMRVCEYVYDEMQRKTSERP